MEGIFELILQIVLGIWENITTIFTPLIDLIKDGVDVLIPLLNNILSFIFDTFAAIIEGIRNIIAFFGG